MATIQTRKRKNGKTTYRVMVRRSDAPPLYKSFPTKHEAMKWATQLEDDLERGRYGMVVAAQTHTVADMIDRYLQVEFPRKPRQPKDVKHHLAWWKSQLGARKLVALNRAAIVEMRDKLASETTVRGRLRAPATVNRYLAALSVVLTAACRDWEWVELSPMQRVRKLREPRGRVRYLSDAERTALLDACQHSPNPYLLPIVVLALSTGMRRGEIMSLTWYDVDLDRRRIVLQHTKNGERRTVPLVGKAHELLAAHAATKGGATLLWPSETPGLEHQPKDITKAWRAAIEEAKLEDFRFHDLRHSAASYLRPLRLQVPRQAQGSKLRRRNGEESKSPAKVSRRLPRTPLRRPMNNWRRRNHGKTNLLSDQSPSMSTLEFCEIQ